ncbi:unnamed protein product [Dracunculus medinensis]|uniref:RING-type E3 ubiquitin transferase BRCA1 n=1 Tax=Dracunculus medinensis TaxID=318479 RepID=A0A0N4U2A3_DRAME|nr:unnamed protein product [Dracunculus medinensis]
MVIYLAVFPLSGHHRSTLSDPLLTTCSHPFCRTCFNECLKRLASLRCPICKRALNRRSCRPCPALKTAILNYLVLARTFIKEHKDKISSECNFLESQVIVPQQCFQKHDQEHHFSQSHSAFKQFSLCQQSNLQGNLLKNVNLLGNEGLLQNNPQIILKAQIKPSSPIVEHNEVKIENKQPDLSTRSEELQKYSLDCTDLIDSSSSSSLVANNTSQFSANHENCVSKFISSKQKFVSCETLVPISNISNELKLTVYELARQEGISNIRSLIALLPWIPSLLDFESEELCQLMEKREKVSSFDKKRSYENSDQNGSPQKRPKKFIVNFRKNNRICITLSKNSNSGDEIVSSFLAIFQDVRYSPHITAECTHFVIMDECRIDNLRTIKYVQAILNGCEIVNQSWLKESVINKSICPTDEYRYFFRRRDAMLYNEIDNVSYLRSIFKDFVFYLPKGFQSSIIKPEFLEEAIQKCGGFCAKPVNIVSFRCDIIIFAKVVVADWILDSICNHQMLPIREYRVVNLCSLGVKR